MDIIIVNRSNTCAMAVASTVREAYFEKQQEAGGVRVCIFTNNSADSLSVDSLLSEVSGVRDRTI